MECATLADEFLADLDSDDELDEIGETNGTGIEAESNEMETEQDSLVSLESIAPLLFSDRLSELQSRMKDYQEKFAENSKDERNQANNIMIERREGSNHHTSQETNSYALTVDCNTISVEIGESVTKIHKLVQDLFTKRFYDLESLVVNPLDYIRVVKRMVRELKLSEVDLTDLLPGPTIMVVKMAASNSTTESQVLTDDEILQIEVACDGALKLEAARTEILRFVESRMTFIAPNLSALVGTNIAARLIGIAGGLLALSRLPASTVQVLGADKKTLEGFSASSAVKKHAGYIYDCELVQQTPPSYRKKVVRVLAPKCALAARMDSYAKESSGSTGERMKEEIQSKVDKWQERPPAKQIKALPAPDEKSRNNRGGKRVRKLKDRFAMTEYRKYANRMSFGVAEETHGNTEHGFGMLGVANRVKLHVVRDKKLQKQLHHRQMQQQRKQQKRGIRTNVAGSVSGIASSLVITPVQGMELVDPEVQARKVQEANLKYFGKGTFTKVDHDVNESKQ